MKKLLNWWSNLGLYDQIILKICMILSFSCVFYVTLFRGLH